jgi:hypothetical protein
MSVALAKSHLNFQTHYKDSNTQKYYLAVKRKKQESDEGKTLINAVNFYCIRGISAMLKKKGTMHTTEVRFFKKSLYHKKIKKCTHS